MSPRVSIDLRFIASRLFDHHTTRGVVVRWAVVTFVCMYWMVLERLCQFELLGRCNGGCTDNHPLNLARATRANHGEQESD